MTIEMMKTIATENNGTIPAGTAMTMTDLEVKRAIKHGFLKEDPKKVQSPELKKEKASKKKTSEKTAKVENKDSKNAVTNSPAPQASVEEFSKEQKIKYEMLDAVIYTRMNDMKKSSFDIAFALHVIYENCYYKIDGYKNIYDYARERYGIARGTTNNFINLVDRFANLKNSVDKQSLELKPEFAEYSSTQLICMLGHTDDELKDKKITPNMSSREIKKALKDSGNGSKGEDINTLNVGGSSSKGSNKGSDSDNEMEETENVDGLKELRCNVVLELDQLTVKNALELEAVEFEDFISNLLTDKVKVICKLLKSGHSVQILDVLPQTL